MARTLGTQFDDDGFSNPILRVNGNNSLVRGFDGFDLIGLGAGLNIQVFGGHDDDTVFCSPQVSLTLGGVTVDLVAGTLSRGSVTSASLVSIENVSGTFQADNISGDGRSNVISGLDGADTLRGNGGDDRLDSGRDTSDDRLYGGAGNDDLSIGQATNSQVLAGVDIAWGGPGDDIIRFDGGLSARAHGQSGSDTFVWNAASFRGRSVICDFEDGVDKLDVFAAATPAELIALAEQVGDNVVINIANNFGAGPQPRVLVLHSFNLADLSVDDFVL